MLARIDEILGASNLALYMLKIPIAPKPTIPEASIGFSSSQFLVALVSGLVIAFGFQFLLTNLSVALVATPEGVLDSDDDSDGIVDKIGQIETKVGLFALFSVTIAVSIATFLAVKLSMVNSTTLGAIVGITIWSTYFSLLVWLGSGAVGSLVGSLIAVATSGLKGIAGAASAAVGANIAKNQAVSTAEDIAAAVRKELTSGLDTQGIKKTLQSSLSKVDVPKLDLDRLGTQVDKLLKDSDLKDLANSDLLKNVNRDTFVNLVSNRTDLSKQDINKIADRLEQVWQKFSDSGDVNDSKGQLVKLLKSIDPKDLNSEEITNNIDKLVNQVSSQKSSEASPLDRAVQLGLTALLGKVLQNTELSDVNVEKIVGQLQDFKDRLSETGEKVGQKIAGAKNDNFNVVKADLENYLLSSPPWKLNRETVKKEFKDVIYDDRAAAGKVRQQLEGIDRDFFLNLLSQRDDFTPEKSQELAEQLESIRSEVYESVKSAESESSSQDLRSKVENYLKSTGKEELNPEGIEQEFKLLLADPKAGVDALGERLGKLDRDTLRQLLSQRQDIDPGQVDGILDSLESTRNNVLSEAKDLQEQAKNKSQQLRQKVEDYLRNTNKEELNPEGIKRDFKTLFEDPQVGVDALKERLSQFDRDTLVQLLSQRQDLSEEQINQTLDQIESVRDSILQAPQQVADKAKEQYEQTTTKIADYLRNTNLDELNPEGIQEDLATLFDDPKAGASALQERLQQVDRDTLVKLLSQGDWSEERVNATIDKVQTAIDNTVKAPRRLARRVQKQAADFGSNLESYLRNTDKEELNPEGIKRDLQLLLQDPQAGLSSLGDRVSEFDRETFVAILSQREDITPEEANEIVDRVESTYKSSVEQIQKVRQAFQSALDSALAKVRDYLNSLDVAELNYEGIQQDFSQLFDDPQAGFEALRHRLGEFDRDTLVALISSRDDISSDQANKIVDRIEATRDRVLQQAERIQQETQKRLKEIKHQARKQAIATQKLAAGAAWWLFGTALTSLGASAVVGFIAVGKTIF